MNIFNEVDKFFASLYTYITFNEIFVVFCGLFLLTVIFVTFSTSRSYEARLIKTIDMFNNYFIDSPHLTEDNLVAFNNKMKQKRVPKQLRKQWQQFVLYREHKASYYMSYTNCVATPLKNSSFKRDISTLNILSYVFAFSSFLLNMYASYDSEITLVLQRALLCPIIILILNYLITIFLELKHNAIVSDLNQNYQYFEVNIDKACETLPEYVDYEILFDKNEIKKGIPILYTYLQKRAEQEQRELDLARLKNVEHEKYNFDESGVAASLVLDRAMQEAENYIAERKKYNQDIELINSDISQEETSYREITKEYNRQMQVSKEAFANFKQQLEDASSSIETNYLKKQQQQELDRQRNLERDFDVATERHKKILDDFQKELDQIDALRSKSKKSLEDAMKSEFSSYSAKIYKEVKDLVEQQEQEKENRLKQSIQNLEEQLAIKNKELQENYAIELAEQEETQALLDAQAEEEKRNKKKVKVGNIQSEHVEESQKDVVTETAQDNKEIAKNDEKPTEESEFLEEKTKDENGDSDFDYLDEQKQNTDNKDYDATADEDEKYTFDYLNDSEDDEDDDKGITKQQETEEDILDDPELYKFNYLYRDEDSQNEQVEDSANKDNNDYEFNYLSEEDSTEKMEESTAETLGEKVEAKSDDLVKEAETEQKEKSKRGRPRKQQVETPAQEKKTRGRPKKVEQTIVVEKKTRGRPKKSETNKPVAKIEESSEPKVKSKRGRPRKQQVETPTQEKKTRGRPKKIEQTVVAEKKTRGRPKKLEIKTIENGASQQKKTRGRPKKANQTKAITKKLGRGRPRKEITKIDNIDEYLKQIDDAIAKESAKIREVKIALNKNTNIRRKK